MSRTVTLAQLRNKIRFQADLIGATVRHPDTGGNGADLTTLINDSIQEFREAISNEGNQHYLVPYSGTLAAGATSPYSFGTLDLSAISPAVVRTYGLDVTVDGVVHSLDHRPFSERNIWGGPATTGIPRHWAHYQTAKLAIQPAPNSAYPYTLWYLPVLADLSGDSDTFDGVAGWEMWIVWDVVCRLLIRDQQGAAFGSAKVYRDDAWARIERQATRVSSAGGAVVGRDTLRGRIPDPLAGRGPVMAGGGPPANHSINLEMLAEVTGPVFLGRVPATLGSVTLMSPETAAGILPTFTPSAAGLVPAAGGSATNKFLSQAGTFETVAGGGGGGSPGGPSGSIQFAGLSGFVGYTGFAVQGQPPSMTVRLPGSLRVTGGTVDVGSGTVRVSASGIDMGGGQLANVSSLFAFPTFAAGVPGLVPASDNDSNKFLNAAGGFATPAGAAAGAASGAVQFNAGGGTFGGYTGISILDDPVISNNSRGFVFGNATVVQQAGLTNGEFRFASGFTFRVVTPSGGVAFPFFYTQGTPGATGGSVNFGNTAAANGREAIRGFNADVASGGVFAWRHGGGTGMRLSPTALDLGPYHLYTRTITVAQGIPNTELATVPSGTVKASLSNATPSDVIIPTLAAFFPTFTAAQVGLVAPGDGDTSKFLNAAGLFAVPPTTGNATGIAGGPAGSVQFRDSLGGPDGASGIAISGSGAAAALEFRAAGSPSALAGGGLGRVRGMGDFSIFGTTASYVNLRLLQLQATGAAYSPTAAVIDIGTDSADRLGQSWSRVGTGGAMVWSVGGTATTARLAQTGMDLSQFHVSVRGLSVASLIPNTLLSPMLSGTVRANLAGLSSPSDVNIPTLAYFFPTFTSNRAGLVAPGDGDTGKFLNAAGAFAAPTGFTFTPTGLPNANLAAMPSGTVKANLSGTAAPSDVLIPTLAAFFPTFTANRAGLVPTSDGDSTKFLNAVGGFAVPPGSAGSPGGGLGNVQFNTGVNSFGGASGVNIVGSGLALGFGPTIANQGDIRVGSGFGMFARDASGIALPMMDWWSASGLQRFGSSGTARLNNEVASGGAQAFVFGGATATTALWLPTGLHAPGFHLSVKSITTPNINGLPADANQLKRGSNIFLASGLALYVPGPSATGANRFIVPSGAVGTNMSIILFPTGAKGGQTIRIERVGDDAGNIDIKTPTGTILHTMPSGTKYIADFVFTKPSGTAFEHGGAGNLF